MPLVRWSSGHSKLQKKDRRITADAAQEAPYRALAADAGRKQFAGTVGLDVGQCWCHL